MSDPIGFISGRQKREWKITERLSGGGFRLRMVLYVSAKTAKSSDIT